MPVLTPQERKVLWVVLSLLATGYAVKTWSSSTNPLAGNEPVERQ